MIAAKAAKLNSKGRYPKILMGFERRMSSSISGENLLFEFLDLLIFPEQLSGKPLKK